MFLKMCFTRRNNTASRITSAAITAVVAAGESVVRCVWMYRAIPTSVPASTTNATPRAAIRIVDECNNVRLNRPMLRWRAPGHQHKCGSTFVQHMAPDVCPGAHWSRLQEQLPRGIRPTVKAADAKSSISESFLSRQREFLSSIGDDRLALVVASMDLLIAPPTIRENSWCIANRRSLPSELSS
jgi:hypothetical protein